MTSLPGLAACSILASLVLYALTGGADFGGGAWALFNRGPRAEERERLIVQAIGPVWETNHIWVIVAIVVLFTGFPGAYALLSTALFLPVTLVLAGIVLRGAAFAFYSYHLHRERRAAGWETLFAASSLLTPFLLGVILGAVSSGMIRGTGLANLASGTRSWLAAFPLSVGMLTLSSFSYLAAVYLILETDVPELREDFRLRALVSLAVVVLLSAAIPLFSGGGAPDFHRALTGSFWSLPLLGGNALAAIGAGVFLRRRAYRLARVCAAAQVTLLLAGWGLAQYPFLIRPDLTIRAAAASPAMLRLLLAALGAGALLLFPAIFLLLRVFKRKALFGR
ncbi:MAG TPA: cytochrome BD ubiquinol oxidase subunit II [Deltaproteobacteria bacterium]|nr:cytochrome BD ubiquinol oxidase subunit II [Deltaproteobacteria bacterium]